MGDKYEKLNEDITILNYSLQIYSLDILLIYYLMSLINTYQCN